MAGHMATDEIRSAQLARPSVQFREGLRHHRQALALQLPRLQTALGRRRQGLSTATWRTWGGENVHRGNVIIGSVERPSRRLEKKEKEKKQLGLCWNWLESILLYVM